jgi:CubicO group peptidase (beta-lactamase class C family)
MVPIAERCALLSAVLAAMFPQALPAQEMSPAYRRNFERQDSSLDRVASADKYEPLETVEGGHGNPIPKATNAILAPEAIAAAMKQADASYSMAVLIYARGKMQYSKFAPGFSEASRFDSYSSHKGLLAVAVLAAVDQGMVKLTDPAAKYIPEWAADGRAKITVADLLWMQSGLFIPAWKMEPFNPVLDMFVGLDIDPAVRTVPLAKPPAQEFEFNHLNAQALHDVIVAASGMRYADFLSRYLWKPLGAADASVALDHPGGTARTVCCFINTAPNWVRIGKMLAEGGMYDGKRILSAESVRLLSAPAPRNPAFGMNVQIATPQSGYLAKDLYYFEGHGGQRLYVVPSLDLVIYRTGRVNYQWDDVTFANTIIAGLEGSASAKP